ncbi:hypothetical protein ANCDUO_05453 [Ancylostoma duodenale]|uniref:Uncharacterized protein n=1 Tax=Ancylostoma duodenale TaxID=51022 RepID=A0A0C2GYL9_9BILA|nr:hypothetical protein ANCDUO_05453 [Ancylostoma duodenale]
MAVGDGHVLWTDVGGSDARIVSKVQLPSFEGPPEQIHVSNNVTYLRSHHGFIYCLDLRVGKTNGSLGYHEVWRREVVKYHGLVFVGYGSRGEVDLFELGTTSPTRALWPSLSDPFTYTQSSASDDDLRNVTTALCVCQETGFVYTGDSEGSLRRWNLNRAPLCEYISGPREMTARSPYRIAYNEMAGSAGQPPTIYELRVPNEQTKLRSYPDLKSQPSTRHRTSISDVLCLQSDLLVSASAEGVIKIWK